MKIYIHTDIEGVAGYVFHADRLEGDLWKFDHEKRMQRLLTGEVNAAIEGALETGGKEIVVLDSHGPCYNFIFEELNPAAQVIHGPGDRYPFWMPCFDDTYDALICIGGHAMYGTNGVLPHSRVDINNIPHNEFGLAMAIAGYFNVPSVFASGDSELCRQVKKYVPNIETAAVKEPLSPYNAKTFLPKKAQEMIKSGVKRGLQRREEIKPYKIDSPYELSFVAASPGFDKKSKVWKGNDLYEVIYEALCTVYDYELQKQTPWPLVPPGEPILNKHERVNRESKKCKK